MMNGLMQAMLSPDGQFTDSLQRRSRNVISSDSRSQTSEAGDVYNERQERMAAIIRIACDRLTAVGKVPARMTAAARLRRGEGVFQRRLKGANLLAISTMPFLAKSIAIIIAAHLLQ